jgi:NADH-quinone oxidoreductase subunit C
METSILQEKFGTAKDAHAFDTCVIADASKIAQIAQYLQGEQGFNMLMDIAGIDYLGHTDRKGPRFAVTYMFKNSSNFERIRVKVYVEEGETVPTLSGIFPIANWQEREVWDLFGIVFAGHPDLRRLLNHCEFEGHPLRKDYPAEKRQWLSENDGMFDQLEARLNDLGYKVLERPEEIRE